MRKLIFILFGLILLCGSALAAFELQEDFPGTTLPSYISKQNTGTSGGTLPVSGGFMTLTPSGTTSGVLACNNSSYKHMRVNITPHANGYAPGYEYAWIGIANNNSVKPSSTSGDGAKLKYGVYLVISTTTGPKTTFQLYEAWDNAGTRTTKNSATYTATNLDNVPTVLDLRVNNDSGNPAQAFLNGAEVCNLSSTNVSTGGGWGIYQGTYTGSILTMGVDYLYLSSSPQNIGTNNITWSSPQEITSNEYESAPTFSFSAEKSVSYNVYHSDTSSWTNGTGTSFSYSPIADGFKDYFVNITLSGSNLDAPVTHNYTWHYRASSAEAPILESFTPISDKTVYQYESVNFATGIVGTSGHPNPSNITWYNNSVSQRSQSSVTADSFVFVANSTGTFNVSAIASNGLGSNMITRNITVLPNSLTISNLVYNPAADQNSSIITFTASNFTPGISIHGWSPSVWQTAANNTYAWTYENGTIIDYKNATSNNQTLVFNLTTVPEGNYRIVLVSAPLNVNFTQEFWMNGSSPQVQFTDKTTSGILSSHWDFGDGTASTERNPNHKYAAEGTYTVNYTVTNSIASTSIIKSVTLNKVWLPVVSFSANTTSGNSPLIVQLNDTSVNATGYYWTFGDGEVSTDQNLTHSYNLPGDYVAKLNVSNDAGYNETSMSISVIESTNFSWSPNSGQYPFTCRFTDLSLNATSWRWDFENDGIIDSVNRNPVHTFGTSGLYSVKLTTTNANGTSSKTQTVVVNPFSISTLNQLYWWIHGYFGPF